MTFIDSLPTPVDVMGLDERLTTMRRVESSWSLPEIPDMVKLDLATNPAVADVGGFLNGLAADVEQAQQPEPITIATPEQVGYPGVAGEDPAADRLARIFSDVAGFNPPTRISKAGVRDFKAKAIRAGILSPDTPIDDRWSPELNGARYELGLKSYQDRIGGDRAGAVPLAKVADWAERWLTPAGLIRAATELDFLPDLEAIGRETADWGSKIGRWFDDPTDLGKLVDAVTGPIDDIALPILNAALLFSGVGEVWAFGKLAMGATQVPRIYRASRGLSRVPGIGRALATTDIAADVARFQRPGFLASRIPGRTGQAMQAWRQYASVATAKKGVQTGMRLGLASRVEESLLPERDRGITFEDIPVVKTGVDAYKEFRATNPITSAIGEIVVEGAFAPINVLEPGSLFGAVSKRISQTRAKFSDVGRDGRIVNEMATAIRNQLKDKADLGDPADMERFRKWADAEKKYGPTEAFVREFAGGDRAKAGRMAAYATNAAALDRWAVAQADLSLGQVGKVRQGNEEEWWRQFHLWRNKGLAQVRGYNPDDSVSIAWALAAGQADSAPERAKIFKGLLEQIDSGEVPGDVLRTFAEHHNGLRAGFMNQLLDELPEGAVENHFGQIFDTLGRWDSFEELTHYVDDLVVDGQLDEALSAVAMHPSGQPLKGKKSLVRTLMDRRGSDVTDAWVSALSGDTNTGRFTVALRDTVDKQMIDEFVAEVRDVHKRLAQIRKLQANPQAAQALGAIKARVGPDRTINDISTRIQAAWIDEIAESTGASKTTVDNMQSFMRWLGRKGFSVGDLDEVAATVKTDLHKLSTSPRWAQFGVESGGAIEDKLKKLERLREFAATRVDAETLPGDLTRYLDDNGYKLVHGVDFAAPSDLIDGVPEIADVGRWDRRKATFGQFFERQDPEYVRGVRNRRLESELFKELKRLEDRGKLPDNINLSQGLDSPDFHAVKQSLLDQLQTEQDHAAQVLSRSKLTGDTLGRVGARMSTLRTPKNLVQFRERHIREAVGHFFGGDQAGINAVMRALKKSQQIGFNARGLQAIEDHLRANPLLAEFGLHGRVLAVPGALTGAFVGGQMAPAEEGFPTGGVLGAVVGGLAGGLGAPRAAKAGLRLLEDSKWYKLNYLADSLANARDYLRFSLSPVFDIQRYTEGAVLAQAAKLPEGVSLPLRTSIKSFARRHGDEAAQRALSEFRAAAKGDFDFEVLESTQRYFTDEGLFGFNPAEHMAAVFGELRRQGVAGPDAYRTARGIFSYGVTGRSAAELSANFVFFPFSFQKKYLTEVGQWMADDMSRAILMTNLLKTYEVLNERYNLSDVWREHLPLMNQLRKVNAFAFGISPGELGGINRPFLDAAKAGFEGLAGMDEAGLDILNVFMPQGVMIKDQKDSNAVRELTRRLVPVFNDVDRFLDNLGEQQHVVFGDSHVTRRAEAEKGWEEWNEFKRLVDSAAKKAGHPKGWESVVRSESATEIRTFIEAKRAEIARKYPAWFSSRAEAAERQIRLNQEIELRLADARDGRGKPGDGTLAEFEGVLESTRAALANRGMSFASNPEDVPEEVYAALRSIAVTLAQRDPAFASLYDRFYDRLLGPIEVEVS